MSMRSLVARLKSHRSVQTEKLNAKHPMTSRPGSKKSFGSLWPHPQAGNSNRGGSVVAVRSRRLNFPLSLEGRD